eukprot:m.51860 g.51860  ORF g.51860 m.51860 type:complete len:425 (+) comp10758_c1_seq1:1692-2966(+)
MYSRFVVVGRVYASAGKVQSSRFINSVACSKKVLRQPRLTVRMPRKMFHGSVLCRGDEITVNLPPLSESISEGEIGSLEIEVGDYVNQDEPVVQVETDKTTVAVNAPAAGIVKSYLVEEGDTVGLDAPLFVLETGVEAPAGQAKEAPKDAPAAPAPVAAAPKEAPKPSTPAPAPTPSPAAKESKPAAGPVDDTPGVTRVKMTRMRMTTANRLKESQNTAAFLTTFNEIDMSGVIALRKQYKEEFEKRHGVKLGFMGIFAKAAAHAAKDQPAVNAFIDGSDIVYHDHVNVSIAVAAPKGLVVPVIRNVEKKSVAEIETDLRDMALKARDGSITIEDMDGGTFTISNGGVFGSLMGTPIINPPQSAVLGMHATFERPVAINGQVEIRPMMYVALTYDHRLIDGREAVTFLRKIKEGVEDPLWMIMG